MKTLSRQLLIFLLSAVSALAQLNLSAAPASAPQASGGIVGAPGYTTYYYMVIANYPAGSVQSNIVTITNGNATLNSTNYNAISWTAQPNAINYDVLLLATNAFSGSCTCSVTTASTSNSYNDQSGSKSLYTVSSGAQSGVAQIYLDTVRYAFPKMRVILNGADHLAEIVSGSTVPSYSVQGDIFVRTGATSPGLYFSNMPNVYTYLGSVTAQECGAVAACSATNTSGSFKVVRGTGTLVTGSPSTYAVTGISPAFTSASTYTCTAQDTTTIANNIGVLDAGYVSGSAVTFTGPETNTDGFRWTCSGN